MIFPILIDVFVTPGWCLLVLLSTAAVPAAASNPIAANATTGRSVIIFFLLGNWRRHVALKRLNAQVPSRFPGYDRRGAGICRTACRITDQQETKARKSPGWRARKMLAIEDAE